VITFKHHPFRFLLQFEWGLLALTALGELFRIPPLRILTIGIPREPGLNVAIVMIMAFMGLQIPTENRRDQWLYTALMMGLMAIAMLGTGMQLFPLLGVVFVMRTGLMFSTTVHRWLTGGMFLATGGVQIYHAMTMQSTRWGQMAMRRAERGPLRSAFRGEMPTPDMGDFFASRFWMTSLSSVILLGLVLLFIQVLISALLSERKSREALSQANQQLREYALRVEDLATVQERDRISREIHDSLGHSLTVSNLHLEAGLRLWDSDPVEAKELIHEAKQQGSAALQAVRHSVSNLRSDPLKNMSLVTLIETLVQDWQRSTQIIPNIQIQLLSTLPESIKVTVYRILQESLTNIMKYAKATAVEILIQQDRDGIQLWVQDNGVGFVRSQTQTGFGLQGMQERSIAVGGILTIETAPGSGCSIDLKIPMPLNQIPLSQTTSTGERGIQ
jgi:signal transduction histidine kinase